MAISAADPQQIVATLDQKAMRLSALLRDVDNHPIAMDADVRERLDSILEMLECRITATRALLQAKPEVVGAN